MNLKDKSFIGIIGKNGTGKSTLLKAITGLLKPVKGNIFIDGNDMWGMPAHQMVEERGWGEYYRKYFTDRP